MIVSLAVVAFYSPLAIVVRQYRLAKQRAVADASMTDDSSIHPTKFWFPKIHFLRLDGLLSVFFESATARTNNQTSEVELLRGVDVCAASIWILLLMQHDDDVE